ncbi:LuxR C-terminal-related transcriptional regulator [Yoonia sp. 2307UL14-13]|uniref:LuxR C-terminal-related transcriptional regulator n=1 Tax=Yoonia sp. 2307UL14-13 TaxID=3126506 RepID=UPI00403FCA04
MTPHRQEVVRLLIAGQSNKEIARTWSISRAAVKDHIHAILKALQLPSRVACRLGRRQTLRNPSTDG